MEEFVPLTLSRTVASCWRSLCAFSAMWLFIWCLQSDSKANSMAWFFASGCFRVPCLLLYPSAIPVICHVITTFRWPPLDPSSHPCHTQCLGHLNNNSSRLQGPRVWDSFWPALCDQSYGTPTISAPLLCLNHHIFSAQPSMLAFDICWSCSCFQHM